MSNNEISKLIEKYEKQETVLQFDSFSNADALDLGMMLVEHAKKNSYPVAINIEVNRSQIFMYRFDGTAQHNSNWMRRKINSVNTIQKSSLLIGAMLGESGQDLEEDWHLDHANYAFHGGAFPIRIKGTGMIGTICISGMPQEVDHQIIVDVLSDYLGVKP